MEIHDITTATQDNERKLGNKWKVLGLAFLMAAEAVMPTKLFAHDGSAPKTPENNKKAKIAMAMQAKTDSVFSVNLMAETGLKWIRGNDRRIDEVRDTTTNYTNWSKVIHQVVGTLSPQQKFQNMLATDHDQAVRFQEDGFKQLKQDLQLDTLVSAAISTPIKGVSLQDIQEDLRTNAKQIVSSRDGNRTWWLKSVPKKLLKRFPFLFHKAKNKEKIVEDHKGTDIRHPQGTPVLETIVGGGTVKGMTTEELGGIVVESDIDGNIIEQTSAHITVNPNLKEGMHVDQGEVLGWIYDQDGYSTGKHEHLAYKVNGVRFNSTAALEQGGIYITQESDLAKEMGKSLVRKVLAAHSYQELAGLVSKRKLEQADHYIAANAEQSFDKNSEEASLHYIMYDLEGGDEISDHARYGIDERANHVRLDTLTAAGAIGIYQRNYIPEIPGYEQMSPAMKLIAMNVIIHKGTGNKVKEMIVRAKGDPHKLLQSYKKSIIGWSVGVAQMKIAALEIKKAEALQKAAGDEEKIAKIDKKYATKEYHAYATVRNFHARVKSLEKHLANMDSGDNDNIFAVTEDVPVLGQKAAQVVEDKVNENAIAVYAEEIPEQQRSAQKAINDLKNEELRNHFADHEYIYDSKPTIKSSDKSFAETKQNLTQPISTAAADFTETKQIVTRKYKAVGRYQDVMAAISLNRLVA